MYMCSLPAKLATPHTRNRWQTLMNYRTGNSKNYYWIEFGSSDFDLIDLVKNFPNHIIGKYIGVVCFDGGVFTPSEEEISRGWYKEDEISYSPKMNESELNGPIYENHDQWCLFKKKTEFDKMTDFVNYGAFTLRDREVELNNIDPTWDKMALQASIESTKSIQTKFWNEVRMINPDSVIVNGDFFIYCSKNKKEINEIKTFANKV